MSVHKQEKPLLALNRVAPHLLPQHSHDNDAAESVDHSYVPQKCSQNPMFEEDQCRSK